MKSLVVFDRRVYRYRYKGTFISKTKANSIIRETKRLVVIDRHGKYHIKKFGRGRLSKKYFKDSEIFKSTKFFRCPYRIMINRNTNMRELVRYEKDLKRNLKDLWKRVKGKKRFYATAVMLRTNVFQS